MAKKSNTRYAVCYTYTPASEQDNGKRLLEQLRYAGLLKTEDQPDGSVSIVMPSPKGVADSQAWARGNCDRLHSQGYRDAAVVIAI